MTQKLETGDVVKLKSGGPLMTVVTVGAKEPTRIEVCWFPEGCPQPESGAFPAVALVVVPQTD